MKTLLLKIGLIGGMSLFILSLSAQTPSIIEGGFNPAPGENSVPINETLTLTFDENISFGTTTFYNIEIKNSDGSQFESFPIFGGISYNPKLHIPPNSNTLTINHFDFEINSTYYVIIPDGAIQGFSGISNPDAWNFTTEAGPPNWTVQPSLINESPTSVDLTGGTDQDGTCYYVVTESLTSPSNTFITEGKDENGNLMDVSGSATLTANNTFTKNIDISDLNSGVSYYIHILAYNGTKFAEDVVKIEIDLKAPSLSNNYTPADNATGVLLETSITLPFNEKLYSTDGTEITSDNASTYFRIESTFEIVPFNAVFSNNDKTITLTPSKILEGNTTYTVSFLQKFEDIIGNEQSTKTGSFSFTTELANKWTGNGADSDWETPENWEGSYTSGNSINIPAGLANYPVIETGTTATVNNLYVEPGASLTLNGGTLNINGLFVLQSSLESNASFIPADGTLNVDPQNVRFHQHIEANDRNYYIGTSVSGATKNSAQITNRLFTYNNDNNTFVRAEDDTELIPGIGYLCRSDNSLIFSGIPVTTNKQVSVQRNNTGGLGWNLISNPFSATIDFNQLQFEKTEITNSFWIWDNLEEKYNTYNAESNVGIGIPNGQSGIPSHQAFWVRVSPGVSTANLTFTISSLQANSYSYLKSASSGLLYPTFKMEAVFNGKKDETAIVFAENASNSLSDPYDTEKKLTSNIDYCQIFTSFTNESNITTNLAINGLQPSQTEISVPLIFKVAKTGIVTFNIKDLTLPPNSQVILEDKEINDFITLNTESSYQFEVTETGTNSSRFVIHFSGTKEIVTSINDTNDNNNSKKASFYTNNSGIIAYIGQLNNPSYRLLDTNGKLIDSGRLNPESENRIAVSRKGMVILIVESEKEKLEFKTVF
ncbi:Ig-like domain-containing protein [Marinilabilia salmonicolor]|uniref:Ig-like domain-containing protein n=1 Tax=Marinilabilia salmonicolor TaxID=989 RepID=UPI00029A1EAB|nr:Ig-like domain-containing protein [Marinilabilia salmonicolor]